MFDPPNLNYVHFMKGSDYVSTSNRSVIAYSWLCNSFLRFEGFFLQVIRPPYLLQDATDAAGARELLLNGNLIRRFEMFAHALYRCVAFRSFFKRRFSFETLFQLHRTN